MARKGIEDWYWHLETSFRPLGRGPGRSGGVLRKGWEPNVDLIEDAQRFILRAELAGVAPEDVQVIYLPDQHALLVQGTRKESPCTQVQTGVHQLEVLYGEFEREIPLPSAPIDPEKIHAVFNNGFLIVYVPKASEWVTFTRVTVRNV